MSVKVGTLEWTNMPTGRWCSTILGHGGHIAVHAFVSGAWAVTRGRADLCKSDDFLVGSREEGRRFVGAELKESYYRQSVLNLKAAAKEKVTLFSEPVEE